MSASAANAPGAHPSDSSASSSDSTEASDGSDEVSSTDRTDRQVDASPEDAPTFVSTPYGIGTEGGNWYHATRDMLEDYAGAVFEHHSLASLLRRADAWLDAPQTLAVWTLPVLLLTLPPLWAAILGIAAYVLLEMLAPSIPHPTAARVIGWMRVAAVQGAFYVFTLSVLAAQDAFPALGIGLAGFVLFRWGVVDRVFTPLLRPVLRVLYPLPVPDQVLRGLIVRTALKHRLELSQLDDMAAEMMDMWSDSPDDPPSARADR